MVSEAEAKEIAGNHVDQIVGGPKTGYSIREAVGYGPDGPCDVTVDVWRVPTEKNDSGTYRVEVDSEGSITRSGWDEPLVD